MADDISLTVEDYRARAAQRRAPERERTLRAAAQAAVKAENLTGNTHWDYYLSLLQAAVETTEKQAGQFRTALEDPKAVSHETMLECKIALRECLARIDAWRTAIALPGQLMRNGEQAKELLAKYAGTQDRDVS